MSANQIAKGSVVSDMLAALVVAREFISTDRNSLADASIGTDGSRDADDQAALNDYDQALKQIDAAIALGDGGSELAAADDEPAFPVVQLSSTGAPVGQSLGMTLRDYFAAKAMVVFIENAMAVSRMGLSNRKLIEGVAPCAYEVADAMLAARQGGAA